MIGDKGVIIAGAGLTALLAARSATRRFVADDGITYGAGVSPEDSEAPEGRQIPTEPREWELDPLPLTFGAGEWSTLEQGVRQRAALLDADSVLNEINDDLLAKLRAGDIITHAYRGGGGQLDGKGEPTYAARTAEEVQQIKALVAAAVGIAFCAKPVVREAADIVIDTPDLRLVLDALGVQRP